MSEQLLTIYDIIERHAGQGVQFPGPASVAKFKRAERQQKQRGKQERIAL